MKHDMADKATTRTQLREDFREYVITNASTWGIDWQPQDMRTDANIRKAKYTTDEELIEDAMALIDADMNEFINNISDVTGYSITCDGINPVKVSAKGYDLSKLGVIDGKYEKNGNCRITSYNVCYTKLLRFPFACSQPIDKHPSVMF